MNAQAVLFQKNEWTTENARKWLKEHNIIPLKRVHKTDQFLRYRIKIPNYKKHYYRIKTINRYPLIKFIIEY